MTSRPPAAPAATGWPVLERSILSTVLGLPGYAAILIAFGFTGLGVFIDLNRINGLGTIFKGCYFAGCLLAVCWVKRRALFGPLVQPPLLLAIAVPGVVVLSGDYGASGTPGLADHLLSIGAPLLNAFPTMAVTTAFTLAIGLVRYVTQRRPSVPEPVRRRPSVPPPAAEGGPTKPASDEGRPTKPTAAAGRPATGRGSEGHPAQGSGSEGRPDKGSEAEGRPPVESRPDKGAERAADGRPVRRGRGGSAARGAARS